MSIVPIRNIFFPSRGRKKEPLHNFAGLIHSSRSFLFLPKHTAELSNRDISEVSFLHQALNSLPCAQEALQSITILLI